MSRRRIPNTKNCRRSGSFRRPMTALRTTTTILVLLVALMARLPLTAHGFTRFGSSFPLTTSWQQRTQPSHTKQHVLMEETRQTVQHSDKENENDSEPTRDTSALQSQQQTHRFHQDMRRVLQARHHNLLPHQQRKNRPLILDQDVDGAERVLSMLHHLMDANVATQESFQIVMEAFVQRGRLRWQNRTAVVTTGNSHGSKPSSNIICAADQLEELLHDWRNYNHKNHNEPISMDTYNLVLQAYANCATPRGDREYAQRARTLLEQMENQPLDTIPVESYCHVLHAFAWQQANRQEGECARQAQVWLDKIVDMTDNSTLLMQAYDWTCEAWSKSGSPNSAQHAQTVFDQMKALNATLTVTDELNICLDAESYCNVILAWSKATTEESAEKSHALLLEMIQYYLDGAFPEHSEPALIAFNGVISAWGRQGRADKAEQVLFEMDRVRPHCAALVPDAMSYNSVLYAHLKSPDKEEGLQRALALVEHMEKHQYDQPAIRPNSFTYNTLMKCWIQSRREDLAEQAEATLMLMEKLWSQGDSSLQPNNRIFNMVINAYAKSKDPHAARKAYSILERMKASSDRQCQPDVISYTSVMECLSKSAEPNAPERAQALLDEAFARYRTTKDPRHMPNARTFTMAILTYAKSYGSVDQARALLLQLLDLYEERLDPHLRPSEYAYNYVLNCAANTLDEDKVQAFQTATVTYQEMRKSDLVKPDSFTYAFWLKCCNNLLPPGDLRTRCISYSFDECKREGLVSKEVLNRLYQGSKPDQIEELLEGRFQGDTRITTMDLPRTWTKNAR